MAWVCGFCERGLGKYFMRYFASMLGGFRSGFPSLCVGVVPPREK